jgi:hypothetical protein
MNGTNSLIKRLRGPRILGLAAFDVSLSVAAGAYVGYRVNNAPLLGALLALPAGILVHQMFSIDTPLNRSLFGKGAEFIVDDTDRCAGLYGDCKGADLVIDVNLKTEDIKVTTVAATTPP